jgi:hypothetical protein
MSAHAPARLSSVKVQYHSTGMASPGIVCGGGLAGGFPPPPVRAHQLHEHSLFFFASYCEVWYGFNCKWHHLVAFWAVWQGPFWAVCQGPFHLPCEPTSSTLISTCRRFYRFGGQRMNEAQHPLARGVRAAIGTGYNRVREGLGKRDGKAV